MVSQAFANMVTHSFIHTPERCNIDQAIIIILHQSCTVARQVLQDHQVPVQFQLPPVILTTRTLIFTVIRSFCFYIIRLEKMSQNLAVLGNGKGSNRRNIRFCANLPQSNLLQFTKFPSSIKDEITFPSRFLSQMDSKNTIRIFYRIRTRK